MSLNGRVLQLEPGEDEDGHILRSFSSQSSLATFFTSESNNVIFLLTFKEITDWLQLARVIKEE